MIAMPEMQDGILLGMVVLVAVVLLAGQSMLQRSRASDRRVAVTKS